MRMILCALSICLTFSRTTSPAAQAAAIAETKQHAGLEAHGDGQQAPRLVRAHLRARVCDLLFTLVMADHSYCKLPTPASSS